MDDSSAKCVKAWARDYEASAFVFAQDSAFGKRFVAWSPEPEVTKQTFYQLVDTLPSIVDVLLKITVEKKGTEVTWDRYHGEVDRWKLTHAVEENEAYIFTDGMHQLCVKHPNAPEYFAFDDHGVFFIYSEDSQYAKLFETLGFARRQEEPIYAKAHLHVTPPNSEGLEVKFVSDLGLIKVNSTA